MATSTTPAARTTSTSLRTWGGLILQTRVEYGTAARRNRGRYAGHKIHRLISEYVVGLTPGHVPAPGTVSAAFARSGRPQLFSCHPACGCTQGQHAGRPAYNLPGRNPADSVTCTKCNPPA